VPSPALFQPSAAGNPIRVVSAKLYHFWKGAWIAEVDLDPVPSQIPVATSGAAVLTLNGTALAGTIDPRGSGPWGPTAKAKLVAGAGAWDKPIAFQDLFQDTGVTLQSAVVSAVAQNGETFVPTTPDPSPTLGNHAVRSSGPGARIFGANDWWVDLSGVTQITPRPTASPDSTFVLVSYDPNTNSFVFHSDAVLMPGTVVTDSRLGTASLTVRDVEQTFDKNGSSGIAWCGSLASSRLSAGLVNLVKEAGGTTFLRGARYRLIVYQGSRMALQSVGGQASGLPDVIPLSQWSGLAGAVAHLALGQEVFLVWDYTIPTAPQPIQIAYSLTGLPQTSVVDATSKVTIGPSAATVQLQAGGHLIVDGAKLFAELGKISLAISNLGGTYTPPGTAQLISSQSCGMGP
jgi:hypothetical protein